MWVGGACSLQSEAFVRECEGSLDHAGDQICRPPAAVLRRRGAGIVVVTFIVIVCSLLFVVGRALRDVGGMSCVSANAPTVTGLSAVSVIDPLAAAIVSSDELADPQPATKASANETVRN